MFAFEESPAILLKRAACLGIPLTRGIGPGLINVRQIDPASTSPGEFAHTVRHAVEHDGANIVVIDSLNGYLNALPEHRYLTAQLHELLSYLNNRGVVTLMIAAQGGVLGSAMRTPIDASYLADTVVMLRAFEYGGRVKKSIAVMKKRCGRHEESIRQIWFDEAGVHLSPPLGHLRGVLTGVPADVDPAGAPHDGGAPEPAG